VGLKTGGRVKKATVCQGVLEIAPPSSAYLPSLPASTLWLKRFHGVKDSMRNRKIFIKKIKITIDNPFDMVV
jgi:hypothetical protein